MKCLSFLGKKEMFSFLSGQTKPFELNMRNSKTSCLETSILLGTNNQSCKPVLAICWGEMLRLKIGAEVIKQTRLTADGTNCSIWKSLEEHKGFHMIANSMTEWRYSS